MIQVAIVDTGYFPIPAVLGGAVASLEELLVEENETQKRVFMHVYCAYNSEAEKLAEKYMYSKIHYIKTPKILQIFDLIIYHIAKNILGKKKHMSYRYILQRIHFINQVSKSISINSFDRIIFENHITLLGALKKHENSKKYQNKYYYHSHNEIISDFGNISELEKSKAIICVSEYIKNKMMQHVGNKALCQFRVLKNRVDENKFRNVNIDEIKELKQRFGIKECEIVLMFTGRLNSEKGSLELMRAFSEVDIEKCKLVIVGSYYYGSHMKSEYEKELHHIAQKLGNKVVFTGHVDYTSMPVFYAMADVIVLPSIWNDPAPLTVIEAITAGKPLITTNSGGIPEYASDNSSVIIEYGNEFVNDLKKAIKNVLTDKLFSEKLAECAREKSKAWKKSEYYSDFLKCIDIDSM